MPIDHLPEKLKPRAECLRAVLMSDAGVMIILGMAMIVRGISYSDLGSVVLFHPIDLLFPLWVDAALWCGVGAALLVAARWPASRAGRLVLSLSTSLIAFWGLLFILAPPSHFAQRGVMYLALAAVVIWAVWRGRRGEIRVREGVAHGDQRGRH